MSSINYTPPPSIVPFFTSEKFISLVCGPVGSTKTTAAILKVVYHAKKMAAGRDGVRRSRAVVIRNTREQLRDTTIPDFKKWLPDGIAGVYHATNYSLVLRFDDVECEVLFRGLDDTNDVRRLLSLQASFGIMDEFREINPTIFEALQGRMGRYPDGMMVPHRPEWGVDSKGNPVQGCVTDDGKPNWHVWGATNAPDYDTFWSNYLENPPANAFVLMQPSGLSEKADWIQYLPSDYYENLAEGKTEDWVNIYVHGRFGRSLSGRPVFPGFSSDFHVAKTQLRPFKSTTTPLIIGLDFGLTPAAVLGQLDPAGRLLIFDSLTSVGMGINRFINEKLKPTLSQRFAGIPVMVVGDPAGAQRAQTDERSCFDILKAEGFRVVPARTNAVAGRLAAVEKFLSRQIDGGPGLLIDPGAMDIIKALRGGYRYKVKKNGETEDSPEKNDSSHCSDALQYLALHADGGALFGATAHNQQAREIKRVSHAGWT